MYDADLSSDPLSFLATFLCDREALISLAACAQIELTDSDLEGLASAAPEVVTAVRGLLSRIQAGELAAPPSADHAEARLSWL
jgi:hypothetical protein